MKNVTDTPFSQFGRGPAGATGKIPQTLALGQVKTIKIMGLRFRRRASGRPWIAPGCPLACLNRA